MLRLRARRGILSALGRYLEMLKVSAQRTRECALHLGALALDWGAFPGLARAHEDSAFNRR